MKKYILKLMRDDLDKHKKRLEHYCKIARRPEQNAYQIKMKNRTEKQILKIESYIERLK